MACVHIEGENVPVLPVRDRPLTELELERLRLLLSTYRDGSGQLVKAGYMSDYLGFERATAFVCNGATTENKGIFDVRVPGGAGRKDFGISCKMVVTQPATRPSWFIEMSNSAKKFHDALAVNDVSWTEEPDAAGPILVELVESWHHNVADEIDLAASRYLLLTHDLAWEEFELACFDLGLRKADLRDEVVWVAEGRGDTISSIAGYVESGDRTHRLWQFYGNSGGQLKYYPLFGWERWRSGPFRLEKPPVYDIIYRAKNYWPDKWPE